MDNEAACVEKSASPKLRVSSIPFSRLPGQSRLFLDYLNHPDQLKEYYPNAVNDAVDVAAFSDVVLAKYSTDRDALADALIRLNRDAGAGEATLSNIERLRRDDTVAVVTGQQAGFLTGPLYTICKALSAIKLAGELTEKGTNAVPVFWVASEDHDFDEVSHAIFRGTDGLVRSEWTPTHGPDGRSVGQIEIDDRIDVVLDELRSGLPRSEFTEDIFRSLIKDWSAGQGFARAFAKTLQRLFSGYGLVVIDPLDNDVKQLCAPIYSAAIAKAPEIVAAIRDRSEKLEASGYHSQVLVEEDYFPFFWHDGKGRRLALRHIGNGRYRVKGERTEFTLTGLTDLAAAEPTRFSPGVMLRPVVQDQLLPTICYFGGGAEIAYFAQNSEAYRIMDRHVTTVLHRQSFTVLGSKQRRTMERLGVELPDLFKGPEQLRIEAANSEFWNDTGRLFAGTEERVNAELNAVDQRLSEIDPTLAAGFAKRRRKMLYHLAAIKKKTLLAQARKHEVLGGQIDDLFDSVLPDGGLQERSLNVFSFVNKYGPAFVDWIYEAIDLDDKGHRIIDL